MMNTTLIEKFDQNHKNQVTESTESTLRSTSGLISAEERFGIFGNEPAQKTNGEKITQNNIL